MKKVFGIIGRCYNCKCSNFFELRDLELKLVPLEEITSAQMELEMRVTGGDEGAESEEEMFPVTEQSKLVS